jgi:hypothetical protein
MNQERAMGFLALLNRLWDGNAFDQRRIGRGHIRVEGRRFTASLMMQSVVLKKLVGVDGGAARGTGTLARFLISAPDSAAGTRLYRDGDMNAPELLAFDGRIDELLSHPLSVRDERTMHLAPPILYLDAAAFDLWRRFHDYVELTLAPCGEFNEMKDFAAKVAEQAARLACVMHIFVHGPTGTIGAAAMNAGAMIAWWHLGEARRTLGLIGKGETLTDAKALLAWLSGQPGPVSAAYISQYGPARIRKKERRDPALAKLYEHGLARQEISSAGTVIAAHPAWRPAATSSANASQAA